ncbi:MAG: tRNA (guanosine(37)-N1)-methyltransferase TrmD [Clostridia bacterium]|nr:tRNA (guanosine(37)-N1)-methyltransferase TrmD [Clostridia bacterium]
MKIEVLTLFPEMLAPMLSGSILGRAVEAGHLEVNLTNIRDYTKDKHRRTDDYPFGGGAGMVMFPQPIVDAIEARDPEHRARRIYMSPRGRTLTQKVVEELAQEESLLFLCGHYEGVDQRVLDLCIDEELSIGDYVLTGGELGALVTIDAVSRLIPGVLGCDESSEDESFSMGLLEYPQYTRPADYRGMRVPEVLLGGNHADITAWRREQSLEITRRSRPDLLDTAPLDDNDRAILSQLEAAEKAVAKLAEYGVTTERIGCAETAAFPKKWFARFVPENTRKAAKKQCFSGRRHIGFLWQAFSMDFAPHIDGEEARAKLAEKQPALLYLPDENVLLKVEGAVPVDAFRHFILTDDALTFTYVQPHKSGFGPYYCE